MNQILKNLAAQQTPTNQEWQQLATEALESPQWTKIFGITPTTVEQITQAQTHCGNTLLVHLFQSVYSDILSLPSFQTVFKQTGKETAEIGGMGEGEEISQSLVPSHQSKIHNLKSKILLSLWKLWLPLALNLVASRQQVNRPFIQGILGGQGTGKTTLATVLQLILNRLGYRTLTLSLDDLYKTYAERQRLQQNDPRFIWRGPPGTHDVELGIELLDQLRQPQPNSPIMVPRFDKSAWRGAGDRTTPEQVENVDVVLFEGWFVGVRPIDPTLFDGPTPAPIDTASDRTFARDMNERLKDYLPLWDRLDRLMVLSPTDYRLSQQWRRQAEQEMIATGKSGMTDLQIDRFVEYFWKSLHPELFITPLTRNSTYLDLVVEINPDHTPNEIYRPGNA